MAQESTAEPTQEPAAKLEPGNRREQVGWYFYDWANSAFSTTVGAVFLGPYVSQLALQAAGADGMTRVLGISVAPHSFVFYCTTISVILQFFFLPILGAIADYSNLRKKLMQFFAVAGSIATMLMFFVTAETWALGDCCLSSPISLSGRRSSFTMPFCRTSPRRLTATVYRRWAGRWAIWGAAYCCSST